MGEQCRDTERDENPTPAHTTPSDVSSAAPTAPAPEAVVGVAVAEAEKNSGCGYSCTLSSCSLPLLQTSGRSAATEGVPAGTLLLREASLVHFFGRPRFCIGYLAVLSIFLRLQIHKERNMHTRTHTHARAHTHTPTTRIHPSAYKLMTLGIPHTHTHTRTHSPRTRASAYLCTQTRHIEVHTPHAHPPTHPHSRDSRAVAPAHTAHNRASALCRLRIGARVRGPAPRAL